MAIVYCGCGGGHDIFSAIGLIWENQKEDIVLVSLSFTHSDLLKKTATALLTPGLYLIKSGQYTGNEYFPEAHLMNSLAQYIPRDKPWSCYVIDYAGLFSTPAVECPCKEGEV